MLALAKHLAIFALLGQSFGRSQTQLRRAPAFLALYYTGMGLFLDDQGPTRVKIGLTRPKYDLTGPDHSIWGLVLP